MKKLIERVALYFPHDDKSVVSLHDQCGTVAFKFVVIGEDGKIRNGLDQWMGDLTVRCQWNTDRVCETAPHTYAWEIEYRDVYAVDLRRAEIMTKTLKRIAKAEAALPIRPTTFGQWAVLMCKALGIDEIVAAKNAGGWSYSETEHHIGEIAEAQWRIDNAIEPHLPKAAPVEQSI